MWLTRQQARELDQRAINEFGMPGVVLMENAGRGMAELLLRLGIQGSVVVCCGRGNNGGDGLVIARHLDNARVPVQILLFARPDELHGDADINYQIVTRAGLPLQSIPEPDSQKETVQAMLARADWIVDALYGTGLKGAVRPPMDEVISFINGCRARVLAVDIPSGLDSDTGEAPGVTVRANHTATVLGWKKGFAVEHAQPYLGQVHLIDLGAPRQLLGPINHGQ